MINYREILKAAGIEPIEISPEYAKNQKFKDVEIPQGHTELEDLQIIDKDSENTHLYWDSYNRTWKVLSRKYESYRYERDLWNPVVKKDD